ncbi:hypothetical protein Cni_G26897 [Canna indica]|uniref:Uncharacterized protein n=1 Tax=Canna indica TaxID=4628 RepID=A0AAQ3QNT1_9LILI|nr:hypothetical protein Cni_G26897 [Canna indica]
MRLLKNHCSYSRVDKKDAEESQQLKVRFLIYKVMEEADSQLRRSSSKHRARKQLKKSIGLRLRSLRLGKFRGGLCVWRHVKHGFITK